MLRVSEDASPTQEEFNATYRRLCASLADLQEAADQIFDTISRRIAEDRDKLVEISERTRKAKNSIDALSKSKDPLVIESPMKYPSPAEERDFRPLGMDLPTTKIFVDGGLTREFGLDGTLELFQFFSDVNVSDVSLAIPGGNEAKS